MKLQYAIVIGAILVGSIGTINMVFISEDSFSANSIKSAAGMMGHVTLTAVNEDGEIIAYRQTDNTVINSGDNCLLEDSFGVATPCSNTSGAFNYVQIGTGSATKLETSTALVSAHTARLGTATLTSLATGNSGAAAKVTAQFTDVGQIIHEAALRNGLGTGDVLALQNFSPINLGANDDLTIEWTVTIDGN